MSYPIGRVFQDHRFGTQGWCVEVGRKTYLTNQGTQVDFTTYKHQYKGKIPKMGQPGSIWFKDKTEAEVALLVYGTMQEQKQSKQPVNKEPIWTNI